MDRQKGPVIFKFNSDNIKSIDDKGNEYFPMIDCKIVVGDGITDSPSMVIQATENLANMKVSLENKEIVKSLADLMKLPTRQVIKKSIDDFFNNQMSLPFLFKDMPQIRIQLDKMPMDFQQQIFQQMGTRSQGGLTNEQQIESQKNQGDLQIKQAQLNQQPQDAQQTQQHK